MTEMFQIAIPGRDDSMLFSMPVEGLSRWVQAGGLFAIMVALIWAVQRLYRLERSYVQRHWAIALLACRMLVVLVVFGVATLQPQVRHVSRETIPSHVLIAIDRSTSMGIADPQRDPTEKIEAAITLHLADDLASSATLERWLLQLKQLDVPIDPAYRKVIDRIDAMSRRQLAGKVIDPAGMKLLETLGERHRLELVGFDQKLTPLPLSAESILAVLSDDAKRKTVNETDLTLPLKQAIERREALKEGLVGVVILSDGQHNRGGPIGETARKLAAGESTVPVHTVVCGAKVAPSDLSIVSLKASPSIVFKHGTTGIEVRLQANNMPAGRFRVTLKYPETDDPAQREPIVEFIDYDGRTPPSPRTIPVKMDRAAAENLRVTVEALDEAGNVVVERFPENNTRQVMVNVAPDKARVLLIDGEARWEQHYLQTALSRDETMQTQSVIFSQPRINLVKEADIASLGLPSLTLPSADELNRQDCIILGDVAPEQYSNAERARLERFVAERGGTLVVLAGKRSMPLQFLDANDPMAKLLPITAPRILDRKDGFRIALTGEGLQTGFLRLENEAWTSEERWKSLPAHYWAVVGKPRPGATVLAQTTDLAKGKKEGDLPLIVRQNYGFGRVVFVGIDSTWRWRFKQGDKYHHRFWSQLIRWAASDRALIAGNEFARFGVREAVYRGDQEIEILVRLGEKAPPLPADATVSARLIRKGETGDEPMAQVTLTQHPEIPGQFEAKPTGLPPGDYELEIDIPGMDDKLVDAAGRRLRAPFQVLPSENGEMLNLAANWVRMKEISDATGGISVAVERAAAVIEHLKSRTATREISVDSRVSTSWWLLLPLIALLTVEWSVRKWLGLA